MTVVNVNYFEDIEDACAELLHDRKGRYLVLRPKLSEIAAGKYEFPSIEDDAPKQNELEKLAKESKFSQWSMKDDGFLY